MSRLNLIVPESLKKKFRKPYGKTFFSINEISISPKKKLVTVDDVVS